MIRSTPNRICFKSFPSFKLFISFFIFYIAEKIVDFLAVHFFIIFSRKTITKQQTKVNRVEMKWTRRNKKFQRTKSLKNVNELQILIHFWTAESSLSNLRHKISAFPIDKRRVYEKILHYFRENKGKSAEKSFQQQEGTFLSCSSGAVETKLTQVWERKSCCTCRRQSERSREEKKYNSVAKTSLDHMASVENNSENVITFPSYHLAHRIEWKTA